MATSLYKGQIPPRTKGQTTCFHHKGRQLDLYCEECQELACYKCLSSVHKNHPLCDLSEITPKRKRDVQTFIEKIENVDLEQIDQYISDTEKRLKDNASHFKKLSKQLKTQTNKLKHDLNLLTTHTLSFYQQMEENNTKLLQTYKQDLEMYSTQLKQQVQECRIALQRRSDIHIFDAGCEIQSPVTIPVKPTLCTASFSPNQNPQSYFEQALGEANTSGQGYGQALLDHAFSVGSFSGQGPLSTQPQSKLKVKTSSTQQKSEPKGRTSSTQQKSEPNGRTSSTQQKSEPNGRTSSSQQKSKPNGRTSSTQQKSKPNGRTSSTQQKSEPNGRTSSTQQNSEPKGSTSSTQQKSEPNGRTPSCQQKSKPNGRTTSCQQKSEPNGRTYSTQQKSEPNGRKYSTQQKSEPNGRISSTQQRSTGRKEVSSPVNTPLTQTKVLGKWVSRYITSVCPTTDGQVWASNEYSDTLTLLDRTGKVIQKVKHNTRIRDISLSPTTNTLWASDRSNNITELVSGQLVHRFRNRGFALCICITASNHVIVGLTNHVSKFTTKGKLVLSTWPEGTWEPLECSPNRISECLVTHNIAVVNFHYTSGLPIGKPHIAVMDTDFKKLFVYGGEGPYTYRSFNPCDVVYNSMGNLIIADSNNNRTILISGRGELLRVIHTDDESLWAVGVDREDVLWAVFGGNSVKLLQYSSV